ncbi:hypothetical protein [Flavobacterium sp. PS2]|uniref:hypothetical protein n=1 Tax=Flavobacterium sp. PS2 TaxID=3384157 RepID=UPI00390C4FD2
MKKIILYITVLMLSSCTNDTNIDEVFTDFTVSAQEVSADGQSTVNLSVTLNGDTDSDRRNVVFKTSSGVFLPAAAESTVVKSEYENGRLIAKATLKVSTKTGIITVSVKPEYDSPVGEYVLEKTITALPSVASTIDLQSSALGIGSNYLTEVQFIGNLRNSSGKFVSSGHKVIFKDFLSDGTPANGSFRDIQAQTGADSKVSCYYAAALYPVGTTIEIKCILLDENNLPNNVSDSVILTINQ